MRCGQLDDAPHLVPHRSRLAGRLNRANVQGGELCSEVWLASRLVRHWHKEELAEEGVQTLDLPAAHVRAASKRAVTLLTCSPRKPAVKGDLRAVQAAPNSCIRARTSRGRDSPQRKAPCGRDDRLGRGLVGAVALRRDSTRTSPA